MPMFRVARLVNACFLVIGFCLAASPLLRAQQVNYSTDRHTHAQTVAQSLTAPTAMKARLAAGEAVSVAVGDFHRVGTKDLVTGYALATGGALVEQQGAREATAPGEAEQALLSAGGTVPAFAARADVTELPVRPELMLAYDVNGDGATDLLTAQRGDSTLYYLPSDGHGGFLTAQTVALNGRISALAAWRSGTGEQLFAAAITREQGSGIELVSLEGESKGFIPLADAASALGVERVNNGRLDDLTVIAGGKALLLEGDSLLTGSPRVDTLAVSNAAAMSSGRFVYDRRGMAQLAVLASDATLHVFARVGLDQTAPAPRVAGVTRKRASRGAPAQQVSQAGMAWSEVETLAGVGSGGKAPLLLRGMFSAAGADTLIALVAGQFVEVAHQSVANDGQMKTTATITIDSTGSPVVAAAPVRLTADPRVGTVTVDGTARPALTSPPSSTYKTYNVNTTTDATPTSTSMNACTNGSAGCTLRAALAVAANDTAAGSTSSTKVDVINLPGGTPYVLSALNGANPDSQGNVAYHYIVNANVSIVGGSACTLSSVGRATTCPVIINANNVDKIFNINSYTTSTGASNSFASSNYYVYLTNIQLENGLNTNSLASPNNGGAIDDEGGSISMDTNNGGSLVLNQVVIQNGTDQQGPGGAIGFYVPDGCSGGTSTCVDGYLEVDNSLLTGNRTPETGGGIAVANNVTVVLANSTITNNTANYSVFPADAQAGQYDGEGGGVFIEGAAAHQSTITNSTISNNTTNYTSAPGGDAGGVFANNGLNVAGTIFSGNSAAGIYGSAGTFTGGGGLLVFPSTYALSVTTSTFTGNTLSSTNAAGAGMLIQSSDNTGDPTYTVSYSRFHGNLIAGSDTTSSGLALGRPEDSGSTTYAAVTATNNWWGCNTDPQTAGGNCDHAHVTTTSHNTLTTTPYTTLGLTLSPTSPLVGNTVAATASLGQNSTGTVYTAATDLAYLATPITGFFINDTSSQNYNPSSTSFSASVSAASNAASIDSGTINNSSTGMATVTVDGFTVTQSFQPTSPDLAVISAHTGNFKAGDTADTYTLTVSNIGTATTAGTVTVTDTPPSGFTATSLSGTGWTCTLSSLACTRSDGLSMSASYPVVTLTVSVSNSDVGTYTNLATVSGGDESNVSNDNNSDSTIVVGVPTISESFSPTTVAPNANSAVTFTLGNPSANSVSLTGVAFSDTLPSGLIVASPNGASTTCTGGTVTAAANGGSISLSGASLAAGTTCTATVNVRSPSMSSYVNTTGTVTATNSNAGGTATATLTVSVSPTRLVFLSVPPSPLTAGGNAGTIQVALEDGSGNVATNNSTGQVTLLVTGPSGYSQSYGPMTITNGVGSFNLSSVPLTTAGSYTYTASATSYTSASTSETINAGTVVALTVSGLTTFTAPGQAETATVRAIDSYGNANASFTGTVTLTSTDPLATFSPASYTYTAGDAGVHAFIVTAGEAGTETVTATSSSLAGSQPVIQVEDAVLAINPGGTLSRLTDAGVATSPSAGYSTSATSTVGLAINSAGNIWTLSPGNNSLIELGKPGSSVAGTFTGGGLNAPDSLAIDGLGQIWIANSNGTVSVFSATGAAVTGATSAYPVGTGATSGIAIDIAGNVWVTNSASGANTVTEILGGAAPVAPLATAVTSLTLGARP